MRNTLLLLIIVGHSRTVRTIGRSWTFCLWAEWAGLGAEGRQTAELSYRLDIVFFRFLTGSRLVAAGWGWSLGCLSRSGSRFVYRACWLGVANRGRLGYTSCSESRNMSCCTKKLPPTGFKTKVWM